MAISSTYDLTSDLNNAINNHELMLYYQPQFNLTTRKFDAVETLVRWQHPKLGVLQPDDFLSVAENTGLITVIGEWVLKTACTQNKKWQDQGLAHIRVAVNISSKQLREQGFVNSVLKILEEANLEPRYLELELVENINMDDVESISIIHALDKLGIQLALDDFGTGYTNLHCLRVLPIDRIKIDKTLINNIDNVMNTTFFRDIVALAVSLNMKVIAEGVETVKQLQLLTAYECHAVQGYYFSEPLPVEQIEVLLKTHQ